MGKSRLSPSSSGRAPPRHARRLRRVPVVRRRTRLLRLAGDLAHAVRPRRRRRRGRAARARSSASSPRSTRRSSRARRCSAAVLGLSIPDNELTRAFDAKLRKTSLEALLAECLRARAAQRAAGAGARGLPLARPRSRATCSTCSPGRSPAARPDRARLPPGRRARRRARRRVAAGFTESRSPSSTGARPSSLIRSKLEQLARRRRRAAGGARGARHRRAHRATRSTSRSCSTTSTSRGSTRRTSGRCAARAARQPAQPDPQPHRHARRAAPAHAQGRERARPRVSRADAAGGLPGARDARRRRGAPRRRCARPTSSRSTGRRSESYLFKHVVTQRGCLREPSVRDPRVAARAASAAARGQSAEEVEQQPRPARAPLLAQRRTTYKKRDYLRRAGDAAQANYANTAAIDYFERARPLLASADGWHVLLELGKVLELVGDWATRRGRRPRSARIRRRLRTTPGRARGRRPSSPSSLASAANTTRPRAGCKRPTHGSMRSATSAGPAACCRSRARSLQSRAISRRPATLRGEPRDPPRARRQAAMGERSRNLGIMAEYDGDYDRSRALHEQGSRFRIGGRRQRAPSRSRKTNLGDVLLLQGHSTRRATSRRTSLRLAARSATRG